MQLSSILRIFLENGNVPIHKSAGERTIRTYCLGKKNWMFHNIQFESSFILTYSFYPSFNENH
nr:transposase [Faecalicatena acetigenes]